MQKEKNKPIVSWIKLNKKYNDQKFINFLMVIINGLLIILIAYQLMRSPLVITLDSIGNKNHNYPARTNLTINELDLESIALNFVHSRYSWEKLNHDSILKSITPFVTNNLKGKIKKELIKLSKQLPKDKKVSQVVTGIKTNVSMDKIIISFDQILKVDGIPLVNPMEIEFLMIKDTPNRLNPLGIYINNITQYEAI
jgi:hypothetical protein